MTLGTAPAEAHPTASIVIPTWNSSSTLPRAIASVEGRLGESEIIIVDDCSDDLPALRIIAAGDPRIKLLEKPAKTNAAHSRALGLAQACGPLVLFLDADDWFLPGHIERRAALHSEQKAGVIIGRFRLNDGSREWDGPMSRYQGGEIEDYIFAQGGDARSSTISVDKRRLGGTNFDAHLAKHQDWGFVLAAGRGGEAIGFDPLPGVVISLAGGTRMSARSNVQASLSFARDHVRSEANRRRFLLGRLRTSLRLGDTAAARQFRDALLELSPTSRERLSSAALVLAGELGIAAPLHRLVSRR